MSTINICEWILGQSHSYALCSRGFPHKVLQSICYLSSSLIPIVCSSHTACTCKACSDTFTFLTNNPISSADHSAPSQIACSCKLQSRRPICSGILPLQGTCSRETCVSTLLCSSQWERQQLICLVMQVQQREGADLHLRWAVSGHGRKHGNRARRLQDLQVSASADSPVQSCGLMS